MPEGLITPDGKPVDVKEVDREFARAMAADPKDATDLPRKSAESDKAKTEPKRRARPGRNERARTTSKKATAPSPQTDAERKAGVEGLVQIGAGVTLLVHQRTHDDAYMADAITLSNSSEMLSDAVVETAKHNARFAAVVDKVTAAGPYAMLTSAVLSVGAQIAANHKVIAPGLMGAVSREEVLASVQEPQNAAA
jgi:hypothetical protein